MKLAVLSSMAIEKMTWWRNLAPPIEEALGRHPEVTIVTPPPLRRGTLRADRPAWLAAIRTVRSCDVVFWIQMCIRPALPLWALAYARPAAIRSVLAVDVWEPDLDDFALLASAQRFRPIFITEPQAVAALRPRYQQLDVRPVLVGYNESGFRDLELTRDIDVFWMGRRDEKLHTALLDLAQHGRITYEYVEPPDRPIPMEELNRIMCRSRYFVVTPPDVSDRKRTGSFSPLTSRYLEGAACGARLLGIAPRSGELEYALGGSAIVECALDGSDLEEVLDRADSEDFEGERLHLRNVARDRHTWQRRADEIYYELRRAVEQTN
jgi:hypothetical protein